MASEKHLFAPNHNTCDSDHILNGILEDILELKGSHIGECRPSKERAIWS